MIVGRTSNYQIKNNFISRIHNNQEKLSQVERQLSTQKKMDVPSQDPIATIDAVYKKIRIGQIQQYKKNITDARGQIDQIHNTLKHTIDLFHRVRSIAVQASNGTYGAQERIYMAVEVEELLREMVAGSNSTYKDEYLFAGSKIDTRPFKILEKTVSDLSRPLVAQVLYMGDHREKQMEIDSNDLIPTTFSGSRAFWGENHMVVARQDASTYVSDARQILSVDGAEVVIEAGDDLEDVIQRINQSVSTAIATKRILPDGSQVLSIEAASPHKLILLDMQGGRVFRDLGIISDGQLGNNLEENLRPDVIENNGSLFEVLIRLRDSLINNKVLQIGGRDLGSIDLAMEGVLQHQARASAVVSRVKGVNEKLSQEDVYSREVLSEKEDIDVAQASIQYHQLMMVHRASLLTAAKMSKQTLLDYLR